MRNLLSLIVLAIATCTAANAATDTAVPYPDPERFAGDIAAFEAADRESPPPHGAIVCVGSSSMRFWHDAIARDLAPLTIVARGFGGSNMNDALFFADRIILPYRPRAIVLYEGDNDVADGISPETIHATFGKLVARVHSALPLCRIYVLSIKPSASRWEVWPQMQRANALLRADCADDSLLTYVDVAGGMLDENGQPKPDIFLGDKLHMNRAGYRIWRDILEPVLVEQELRDEDDRVNSEIEN